MKKILYSLVFFVFMMPSIISAKEELNIYSNKYIIYDFNSNEVLLEKDSDTETSIASLTKIMTTIVAIENINNLDEYVCVTSEMLKDIPYDASVAGLKVGDRVTYKDLLYASILPSGADATTILAFSISGSTQNFINLMNKKAKDLGLNNTHYSNVTGYDIENHYSTVNDILKLLLYSLENPLFKEIYETNTYILTNGLKVQSTINKYNKILGYDVSNILGSKTGYTYDAGLCMSALVKVKDNELIIITLGADYTSGKPYNLIDTLTVIEYMNNNYSNKVLFNKGDILTSIPIINSKIDSFDVLVNNDISKYIENDYNKNQLTYNYEGLNELSYKNKKNEKIGNIKYYYKDKMFYEEDIYLTVNPEFSLSKYFISNINYFISIFLILIILIILFVLTKRVLSKKKSK